MRLTEAVPLCLRPASRGWPGVVLLGCFGFSLGTAAPTGDELLRSVDAALNPAAILRLDYAVVTLAKEPWASDQAARMTALAQSDKRLYEFVAPSDMCGTKLLILSPEKTYVYLPAFGKVRRVLAKANPSGLFGMFAAVDLGAELFSTLYAAQITEDNVASCVLKLTPKPDVKAPYARIDLTLEKPGLLPVRLEYFDEAGTVIKTETRRNYDTKDEVSTPRQIRMIDHRPEGGTTTHYLLEWDILTELPTDAFSRKALEPPPVENIFN